MIGLVLALLNAVATGSYREAGSYSESMMISESNPPPEHNVLLVYKRRL